ncbi:MAG: hypothetical protein HOP08_05615 [Cyclobacteriaceae bacterium]|nr:hypothetical protein [Cyclobacteriaceae bacterium]
MSNFKNKYFIIILIIITFSCNHDEQNVVPVIDNEALTTVIVELVNVNDASDKPTAQWEQLFDNNGNPQPVDISQANIILKPNSTYNATLTLLDKTQSPAFIVSDEVKERENYHLVFYQPLRTSQSLIIPNDPNDPDDIYPEPIPTPIPAGNNLNLSITITDHDTNVPQLPLGLDSKFVTGTASTGWLRIVLRHQPNGKDGSYAPGETDLDVGFTVTIQ